MLPKVLLLSVYDFVKYRETNDINSGMSQFKIDLVVEMRLLVSVLST